MVIMKNTISSEYAEIERTIREAVEQAKERTDAPLVIAMHPAVDRFIKLQTGVYTMNNIQFGGAAGVTNVIFTEDVASFRVIICNENI